MTQKIQLCGDLRQIEVENLGAWDANPRTKKSSDHIENLKASIRVGGLLQNFVAVPDPKTAGRYLVIAGGSRLAAVQELQAEGAIAPGAKINVDIRDIDADDAEALMIALSENAVREQMDPIDECLCFAELARRGETPAAIAVAFGMTEKTVKQRMALGRIVPEAQDLIRDGARDLDWGKAMSMADQATQQKIVKDVAMNPAAWKDGNEVRRFLTQDTIPAAHALFDLSLYKGVIVRDMFEGDRLADREEFWALQRPAIDARAQEVSSEGFQAVHVSYQPVDLWRFQRSDEPTESIAILEVAPNGRVVEHRGLVRCDEDQSVIETLGDDDDAGWLAPEESISGDAVRATGPVMEYLSAQRSAMIQTKVGADFRSALEIAAAGLIGHAEIQIRAQDYKHPGDPAHRVGGAFDALKAARDEVDRTTAPLVGAESRNARILETLAAMDDAALQALFSRLVANKIGQPKPRALDQDPDSLMNAFGRRLAVDVRACWTPDEAFFSTMQAGDLRRMAKALLPADRQKGVLTAKRRHLARMLADAFTAAAEGDGTMDAASRQRLNAWVPGALRFPAVDDAVAADAPEATNDPFAAIFGGDAADSEETAEAEAQAA